MLKLKKNRWTELAAAIASEAIPAVVVVVVVVVDMRSIKTGSLRN